MPTRIEECYSLLNSNDNINHILANVDINTTFAHRNLRNYGADLMFYKKVGLKIWVHFKSKVVWINLVIATTFLKIMN